MRRRAVGIKSRPVKNGGRCAIRPGRCPKSRLSGKIPAVQFARLSSMWLERDIYSQLPVNDIAAIRLAAASSQSCSIAKLKANQRSPFILQTQ